MADGFVKGKQLRELFSRLNPFDDALNLKPVEKRHSILAANVNFPFELQVSAFIEAASLGGGSPLLLQVSGASLSLAGSGLRIPGGKPDSRATRLSNLRLGARLLRGVADVYWEMYRPPFVALGLDHFAVPGLGVRTFSSGGTARSAGPLSKAGISLADASRQARRWGADIPAGDEMAAWEAYLRSDEYKEALEGFLICVTELRPAWAMVDTEDLPPVLDFAVTKEVADRVKAFDPDIMVEAEYGPTGQAGDDGCYAALRGEKLDAFARQVAGFVEYSGARGISYPIGMEHAAPGGEFHEPDVLRLEAVQREIIKVTGGYVPFAQHGGTGAKSVARGLVGKNNVNTHFLVTGAKSLAEYTRENAEGIARGLKAAGGTRMYLEAGRALVRAAVTKMEECGSFGICGRLAVR